ncbi:MAG: heavy metal-binding domain-containing protein [Acidimicrobiia bacterium]|nr:heavy metal-binding domain-containing protein [Acidimicrobiia bacterium]
MVQEAEARGANGIIGMRFDSGAIGQWSEICAYGTAVAIAPVSDIAKTRYEAMVQAGRMPHQQVYATTVREWATAIPPMPYEQLGPQQDPAQPQPPPGPPPAQPPRHHPSDNTRRGTPAMPPASDTV